MNVVVGVGTVTSLTRLKFELIGRRCTGTGVQPIHKSSGFIPRHPCRWPIDFVAPKICHVGERDSQYALIVRFSDHVAADFELAHVIGVTDRPCLTGTARYIIRVSRIANWDELHRERVGIASEADDLRVRSLARNEYGGTKKSNNSKEHMITYSELIASGQSATMLGLRNGS